MRRIALFAEAWCTLALASALCGLLPFRLVARIAARSHDRLQAAGEETALRLAWAIGAAARRSPWRAVCFEQGIAAQLMLRRRRLAATLHYGAAFDRERKLVAHVWVTSNEMPVVGCQDVERFGLLASFPPAG